MMTDKYYPRGEIKKLKVEMWNLKVKGTDVVGYNQRFQELALMCARMFPEESDKFEKYVGGLPDLIHRSVMASNPKTMKDAIEFATELMDKKIGTLAERQEGVCWNSTIMQQVQVLSQWPVHWHYKSDCPELKNQNHENQAEGTEARGMVYAFGGGETVQDPNTIEMRSKLKDKCCLACLVIPKVGNNLRLYLL
ncbi:hypothetical protein Tco_0789489 [Tanacetum coccineum]